MPFENLMRTRRQWVHFKNESGMEICILGRCYQRTSMIRRAGPVLRLFVFAMLSFRFTALLCCSTPLSIVLLLSTCYLDLYYLLASSRRLRRCYHRLLIIQFLAQVLLPFNFISAIGYESIPPATISFPLHYVVLGFLSIAPPAFELLSSCF